jgi:hypothetical protein
MQSRQQQRLIILAALSVFGWYSAAVFAQNEFCYPEGRHGFGELKYHDNVPVLTVVKDALHAVNQRDRTVNSMVFEPKIRRTHLVMGPGPVTGKPNTTIDLIEYFQRN